MNEAKKHKSRVTPDTIRKISGESEIGTLETK
jgi:hypothetical protein